MNLPKKILITGTAGFIGSALSLQLLKLGYEIIGIDNHNSYYDQNLKESRLKRVLTFANYTHYRTDLTNRTQLKKIFKDHKPNSVVNLAAQAGVRYSLENPLSYIDSNIFGFANILECCRYNGIEHLVYASSSSVYGANTSLPFSIYDNVDHPLSVYAATKKSNELMAHAYSHLYNIPSTGLRFFTVYGPWDRPDMALQKFAKSIVNGDAIKIFNYGKHERDFTYIDDIVDGIIKVIFVPAKPNSSWSGKKPEPCTSLAPWKIYNIGNNRPVNVLKYLELLEKALKKKAKKEFLPIQPGDVANTWANVEELERQFNYKPKTSVEKGIKKFAEWFIKYYKI
jgi:UDP-glucuronate 4-epimerase